MGEATMKKSLPAAVEVTSLVKPLNIGRFKTYGWYRRMVREVI